MKWGLVGCIVLGCLLMAYSAEVTSNEPAKVDNFHLLFPPNHAVLLSGDIDVICRAKQGNLEVEGEVCEWEPFEPPLRVAHLNLYPGRNRLQIGTRQLEIFLAKTADEPAAPKGWEIYRNHSIDGTGAKRCAKCHETKQNGELAAVGEVKSYRACFECHKSVEFEAIHSHPLEPIEHCQMCHALHGSKHKALLKAPVKKLCADCHDS